MLTIVAIGRNEAENLSRLIHSIKALIAYCNFPIETVFVDSASQDDSVEIASAFFDVVCQLEADDNLCASAGRYVGTLEAENPFVFYIDADMEVEEEQGEVVM